MIYLQKMPGIHETTEYLELFLKNLILGEKNELHNRAMHISGQFVQSAKVDIQKEVIDTPIEKNWRTTAMNLLQKLFGKLFSKTKSIFTINIEYVVSIRVYRDGEEGIYRQEQITNELIQVLLNETLAGNWNRFVMNLQLPGEEEYIARVNKTVTSTNVSTLVIHAAKEQLACLYYVDKTMHCHMLIGNMDKYHNWDSSQIGAVYFGQAEIPEYGVCREKKEVEKGIQFILEDLANADKRLQDSKLWGTDYPKGKVGYGKLRKTRGLLQE